MWIFIDVQIISTRFYCERKTCSTSLNSKCLRWGRDSNSHDTCTCIWTSHLPIGTVCECVRVRVYVCMWVCVRMCACVRVRRCVCVRVWAGVGVRRCACACVCACMRLCVRVRVCATYNVDCDWYDIQLIQGPTVFHPPPCLRLVFLANELFDLARRERNATADGRVYLCH